MTHTFCYRDFGAAHASFVGRERCLGELATRMERHPLITVTGPAGAGKTRFAIEAMRRFGSPLTESGAPWFCDLTEARTEEALCSKLAATLDLSLGAGGSQGGALARIGQALAARGPAMLVIDNFEQLVPQASDAVGRLVRLAPEVRFVVTSRVPLGLAGEVIFVLDPLALPESDADVLSSEAGRLFVERAGAVCRNYRVEPADLSFVGDVVRRLDGLPLAIELAAARTRVLGIRQLAEHLRHSFDLLRTTCPTTPPKQATLRGAIDWSWELLRPWEQRALAQCAVFEGGFTLDAVAQVIAVDGDGNASTPIDVIQCLVDRSLVTAFSPPGITGRVRFRLLESIRCYAQEKLVASGEAALVEGRHRDHYLELAAQHDTRARLAGRGAERGDAAPLLALEIDNLLAIHRRALEGPAPGAPAALEAALALDCILARRGPMKLRFSVLTAAIDAAGAAPADARLLTRGLIARADAALALGLSATSRSDAERAIGLTRDGDALRGHALAGLARQAWHEGRVREARECFEAALASLRSADDRRAEGQLTLQLGNALYLEGRLTEARARYESAIEISRRLGDRAQEVIALGNLAGADSDLGRLDDAWHRGHEALALQRELGDRYSEGNTLMNLGIVALERRDLEAAHVLIGQAIATHQATGNRHWEGIALGFSGIAHELRGDLERAAERYRDALVIHRDARNGLFAGLVLCSAGRLHARAMRLGDARAAIDLGEAEGERSAHAGLCAVAALCRAEIELSEALALGADHVREASAKIALLLSGRSRPLLLDSSSDARIAHRLLSERFEPLARPAVAAGDRIQRNELVIAVSGRWFQPPRDARVTLGTRRALRLLLQGLADRRSCAADQALALDELVALGWPGERVRVEAGASRVYAAISTLRTMGLRDLLLRRDDGYLLDPRVPMRRAPDHD